MVDTTCVHVTKDIGDELTIGDVKITFLGVNSKGAHKLTITSTDVVKKMGSINSKPAKSTNKWLILLALTDAPCIFFLCKNIC